MPSDFLVSLTERLRGTLILLSQLNRSTLCRKCSVTESEIGSRFKNAVFSGLRGTVDHIIESLQSCNSHSIKLGKYTSR